MQYTKYHDQCHMVFYVIVVASLVTLHNMNKFKTLSSQPPFQFILFGCILHPNTTVIKYCHERLKFRWKIAQQVTIVATLKKITRMTNNVKFTISARDTSREGHSQCLSKSNRIGDTEYKIQYSVCPSQRMFLFLAYESHCHSLIRSTIQKIEHKLDRTFLARVPHHLIVYVYVRRGFFITLFIFITMLCRIGNIPQNILKYSPLCPNVGIFYNITWNIVNPQIIVMNMNNVMLFF